MICHPLHRYATHLAMADFWHQKLGYQIYHLLQLTIDSKRFLLFLKYLSIDYSNPDFDLA